jgi:hypothetical protein
MPKNFWLQIGFGFQIKEVAHVRNIRITYPHYNSRTGKREKEDDYDIVARYTYNGFDYTTEGFYKFLARSGMAVLSGDEHEINGATYIGVVLRDTDSTFDTGAKNWYPVTGAEIENAGMRIALAFPDAKPRLVYSLRSAN